MKKLACVWMFLAVVAMAMVSCGKDDPAPPAAPAAPTATPTPCGTVEPGGIYMVSTPDSAIAVDAIHAFPVTFAATGTVNQLGIYMRGDRVTSGKMALYTNSGSNAPQTLLSQSETKQLLVDEVTKFAIPPVAVNGAIYWVAIIFSGAQPTLHQSSMSGSRYYIAGQTSFPAVAPAGTGPHSTGSAGLAYYCN
jgi:hypothetical protein